MKKVGIILVGYKDYVNRFLPECRDSLRAQNYPKEFFQVYIVDNCSINDCEYVKINYPEAKCATRPDGNYAAANNLGIKMASEDGCEYFVIANMDVKFDSNWLAELVKAIESDPKIGMAQSKILKYPASEEEWKNLKINSLGNMLHYLGFGFTSHYGESDHMIGGYPEIKGYASGCSFIVKKEVIDKIGDYNEDYYMYHDDLELGWRSRIAGYKTVLAPKSIVYHKYEFSRSVKMLYFMERNRHIAVFSFYRLPTIILILPALIAMDLGMLFFSMLNGWFLTNLKICGYFFKPSSWVKIIKERKKIKKLRIKKDYEVAEGFAGEVLFQEIANPVLKHIANPIFNFYWKFVYKVMRFIKL